MYKFLRPLKFNSRNIKGRISSRRVKGFTPLHPESPGLRYGVTGFTLTELILASAILFFTSSAILLVFMNCIVANEASRNTTLAYAATQAKMEELRNAPFGNLDTYNGVTFDLNGFALGDAKGTITVGPGLSNRSRNITITVCFKVRNRLIGDSVTNCQNSPVTLVTLRAE